MDNKKLSVIYILSEKSSGSSFLHRSLVNALGIDKYPKTKHFESETLYWTKAASVLCLPQLKMLASSVPYSQDQALREIKAFLIENLGELPEHKDDRELIFKGWFMLIEKFGPVFIEKSPHHLLQSSVLELMRAFEKEYCSEVQCHYIGIVRNPKDVFLSQFRRWNVSLPLLENQWLVNYMNWFAFTKQVGSSHVLIRYEDLVAKQMEIVDIICRQAGLESRLNVKEKARIGKAAKQSSFFGYNFSSSVISLSQMMGYSAEEVQGKPNFKWQCYSAYIRYLYSPAKKFYVLLKG